MARVDEQSSQNDQTVNEVEHTEQPDVIAHPPDNGDIHECKLYMYVLAYIS
jgi:hypothetical protein